MGIRRRVAAMILVVAVSTISFTSLVIPRRILGLLDELDRQDAVETAQRLEAMADLELTRLHGAGLDWGSWNDTRAFVVGDDPGYPDDNFSTGTLTSLGMGAFAILDADGRVLLAGEREPDGATPAPASQPWLDVVRTPVVWQARQPGTSDSLVVNVDGRVWLLSATAISDSQEHQESAGTFVWACEVNDTRLDQWAEGAGVRPVLADEPPPSAPEPTGGVLAYGVALDVDAGPDAWLQFDQPRDAMDAGRQTALALGLLFLVGGTAASIWFGVWLDRRVVHRLLELKRDVDEVDLGSVESVKAAGDDEISDVAWSINRMLDRLAVGRRELDERNAELEEANRTRDAFVSMISHELRTPLTAIIGFSDTVMRHWHDLPDERRRDLIDRVASQGRTLDGLVEDLLVLRRTTEGDDDGNTCDLDESLSRIPSGLPETLANKVTVDLGAPEASVPLGEEELRRLVSNLLVNAGRYGRPPIEVATRPAPDDDGTVVLSITDHGDGIPDDFVQDLFKPFTQASRGDRRTARGVGLGLSIVQALVVQAGGSIHVEAPDGGGARFVVRLPVVPVADRARSEA